MHGAFITTTKQNTIEGVGGRPTGPMGLRSSAFFNRSLKGEPRLEDLFTVRILGQTAYIEMMKDIVKKQVASTPFTIRPTVENPTPRHEEAAERIEEFLRGEFNSDRQSWDDLINVILDDTLDMASGILELVPDSDGFLEQIIARDGLTFTKAPDEAGLLPAPDSGDPAYWQFSLSSHAKRVLGTDAQGIDVRNASRALSFFPHRVFKRKAIPFARDQIVWFDEGPVSYSPYGRGRTMKVKQLVEVILNGDLHRSRFFRDNEFHKGVLQIVDANQQDIKKMQSIFDDSRGNEYQLPIVGGTEAKYIQIDPDPEKMQFLESHKWYITIALMAYGLNEAEAGLHENANLAVSEEMKFNVFRRTTSPILSMLERRFNNEVLPFIREYNAVNGELELVFDPEDRFLIKLQQEIDEKDLSMGASTLNELRLGRGKEPYGPLGDLPKSVFDSLAQRHPGWTAEQISELITDTPSAQPSPLLGVMNGTEDPADFDIEALLQEAQGEERSDSSTKEITCYKEAFDHTEEILDATKDALRNDRSGDFPPLVSHKNQLRDKLGDVFKQAEQPIKDAIQRLYPGEDTDNSLLIDVDNALDFNLKEPVREALEEANMEALEESADFHASKLKPEAEERAHLPPEAKIEITFELADTFTAELLRQQALQSATGVDDAVKSQLRRILLTGAKEGWGINRMTEEATSKINTLSKSQAELVARTETLNASRMGSQALAESTELVGGKEWIATNDSRTRKWHEAMDGVIVPKNDSFQVPSGWAGPPDYQPRDYPRTAFVVGQDQPFNCFDAETEILTDKGWVKFPDLDRTEKVLTLNMETEEMEWQEPTDYVEQEAEKLIKVQNRSLDVAATPDHDMVIRESGKLKKKPLREIVKRSTSSFPALTKGVKGRDPKTYTIPVVKGQYEYQDKLYKDRWAEKDIDIRDWAKFLGIYLAEGYTTVNDKSYSTHIAATKPYQRREVTKLLEDMGYDPRTSDPNTIIVNNKQLALETEELSKGASNKTIPGYVFTWSKNLIETFLDWYEMGDGNRTKWGRRIWTTSRKMADQLQTLFILVGRDASIFTQEREETNYSNNPKTLYCVQERSSKHRTLRDTIGKVKEVAHNDKTYCVTVPNGTLVVRRNDKPLIAGNCRCAQAPVLKEDMPRNGRRLGELQGVEIKTSLTDRQLEIWCDHAEEGETFKEFWNRATSEMDSVTEVADAYGMSKRTVYKWNDEFLEDTDTE